MRKLGTVLHVSSQMNIIVRTHFKPDLGKKNVVTDKNQSNIGYISDVIGPINNPYILIKPYNEIKDSSKLIGEPLFVKIKKKEPRKKDKGRRN